MRRAARLAVLYVLEAIAALLALCMLAGGALLWRLAEGPLDAEILREPITDALTAAVEGQTASVGTLQVRFDPASAALVVMADEVQVADAAGDVIISAERIETALALDLLLVGRARPVSIEADGGVFSIIRTRDGALLAGLGAPQSLNRDRAEASEPGGARLGALSSELDPDRGGLLARLQRLDLSAVDLRLVDEASELDWFINDAALQVDIDPGQVSAAVSGDLVTSAGLAPVRLRLESGRALEQVLAEFSITGFVPAAAAPRRGALAGLAGLEAQFDANLIFDASVEDGLRTALLEVSASEGEVRAEGQVFPFGESAVRLEFDAPRGVIDLQQLRIDSDLLQLDLTGRIADLSAFAGALPTRARFEIEAEAGAFDLAGVFPEVQAWTGAFIEGRVDTRTREILFEQLNLDLPNASGRFSGRLALDELADGRVFPAIRLAGPIDGEIGKADVLRHWPVDFALGARDWVRDSILDGRLTNARLALDLPAQAIAERMLRDEHLSLSFGFADADVRYVSTMPPLTGLSGEAELRGNSLSLTGAEGRIDALAIDTIFVEIPRLNPKGAFARFGGTGAGQVQGLLELLSEPPLAIADRYGLDPASFEGDGRMSFEIRRPMRRFVPMENIGYQIDGAFENVAAPTGVEGVRLEQGVVAISANPQGLRADGTAQLAGSDIEVEWTETFGLDDMTPSTRVLANGRMTGRGLDRLGLPVRRFMDGVVGVEAELAGRGFDFSEIELALDLADAAVVLPAQIWEKDAGAPGEARFGLSLDEAGAVRLDPLQIRADGIDLTATAAIAPDGRLLSAQVSELVVPGRIDVQLAADRPDGLEGPLRLALSGDYVDLGETLNLTAPGGGGAVSAPLLIEAQLDRVLVNAVTFEDLDLSAHLGPDGLESAGLIAAGAQGGVGLLLDYALDEDTQASRRLTVRSDDAGRLLRAFAGFDNVSGGRLRLDADSPLSGQAGPMSGRVEVDGFTLEEMPLLARILAAGSLEGLGGLLSGDGIDFERLETDFTWSEGSLALERARAVGPSLGATWQGLVGFEDRRINVDGTLLPSYGANSILGGLPLVGELLTSRRGEGVFGVTFSVTGPFDETRVVANPLAAFAPGVFRRVFEGTAAERELDELRARLREAENGPAQGTQTEPEPSTGPRSNEASEPASREAPRNGAGR